MSFLICLLTSGILIRMCSAGQWGEGREKLLSEEDELDCTFKLDCDMIDFYVVVGGKVL